MNFVGLQWMGLAVTRTSDLAPEYVGPAVEASVPWLMIAMVVIAIASVVGVYCFMRCLRVPALAIADDLTLELCRAHNLGLSHRAVMDHVARVAGVEHTAELFLSPIFYDRAVSAASNKKRLKGSQRDLLHELRRLLFDEPK